MSKSQPRTGYELVAKILETHPNDAIETMLKYSNGAEADWLEFKAGMTLQPEDEKRGDKPDDLYWDYLLSIVAMANTRGGAFVIGVNDKTHEAVPLESCDKGHVIEKRGKEAYLREVVVNNLDRPDLKWTTKDRVVWSLPQSVVPSLEKRIIPYGGTDVIVILVPPRKLGDEFFVRSKSGLGEFKQLPVRDIGEIGHVKRLTMDDAFAEHKIARENLLQATQLGVWWDELDAEVKSAEQNAELDEAIRAYYAKLKEKTRKRLQAFVPLDAASDGEADEEDESEFEDPTAVSVFDEDDEPDSYESKALTDEDTEESDEADSNDEGNDSADEPDEPKSIRMGLMELLGLYDRVVLSGEPGAGKTTCLAHFAVERGKEQGDCPHLFAFVQLGRWAAGGSVLGLVGKACGLTLAQIDALLEQKRLHLVLDALNECPDHLRPAALENIRVLGREHPDLPIILSMRRVEALRLPGFPVFEVQAMDRDRQRQFLERHLGNADKAAAILDALEKQPGGASIAQNPMLLKMVVDVVRNAETLPSGRATLYRAWLEKWYAREEKKARQAVAALPWTAAEAMRLLARMAFAGRAQGYRDIPLDLARQSLDDADGTILGRLCQGPLLDLEEDFVHFRHETFQEYLCAEWLLTEPTALDALPQKDYDTWGMPIAYAAELRLPGKLPGELSDAVWEMNPWVAALVAPAPSRKNPVNMLSNALFHDTSLLSEELSSGFHREISDGSLFQQTDAPLSYLVFCSDTYHQIWKSFECAYVLHLPSFACETFLDGRHKTIQQRKDVRKLRNKVHHLRVLSQGTVIPAVLHYFPAATMANIVQRWGWFFENGESLSDRVDVLDKISADCPNCKPLPIEMLSVCITGASRAQIYSELFGADFIEKCLDSIASTPDCWMSTGTMQLLMYAAKQGFPVHEATRSFLLQTTRILEGAGVSPVRPLVTSLQSLCGLLDETDVPALLPKLSSFGRAMLKRLDFNPQGGCDPFYRDLPTADDRQFRKEDLRDVVKRREIVTILLNNPLVMTVVSNKPLRLENDTLPTGIKVRNRLSINGVRRKRKKSQFQLESQWLARVDVCCRGRYQFYCDNIQSIPHKAQYCAESQPSSQNDRRHPVQSGSDLSLSPRICENQKLRATEKQGLLYRCLASLKGNLFPSATHHDHEQETGIIQDDPKAQPDKRLSSDDEKKDTALVATTYHKSDLEDQGRRQQIEFELKKSRWDMEVAFISEDRGYLFFKHFSFPDNVYCPMRSSTYKDVFQVAQTWNVRVHINQIQKERLLGVHCQKRKACRVIFCL